MVSAVAFPRPGIAEGQDAVTTEPRPFEELVVTATRNGEPLRTQAGNTSRFTASDIDFIRHDHIAETLNRAPGVGIHRGNGQDVRTNGNADRH